MEKTKKRKKRMKRKKEIREEEDDEKKSLLGGGVSLLAYLDPPLSTPRFLPHLYLSTRSQQALCPAAPDRFFFFFLIYR